MIIYIFENLQSDRFPAPAWGRLTLCVCVLLSLPH